MWRTIRVWWHKRKAVSEYLAMERIQDEYSCGVHMLQHASPRYNTYRAGLKKHLKVLKKIDPKCPSDIEKQFGVEVLDE